MEDMQMAMGTYIGVPGPVYEDQDGTPVNITVSNIATHFTVTNGSYRFNGSGSVFTTNNGGVASSTASTTLKALYDMKVSFDYSYASEANFDKFTLKANGVTIENAVSGAETSKAYSGTLLTGQTLYFEYKKDGSSNSNGDKCTFYNMVVTPFETVQVGEAGFARTVVREYKEDQGVARKIRKAYKEVGGVARQVFWSETKWKKYNCILSYRYSDPTDFAFEGNYISIIPTWGEPFITYPSYTFSEAAGFRCTGEPIQTYASGSLLTSYSKHQGTYFGDIGSRIFKVVSVWGSDWVDDDTMDDVEIKGVRHEATATKTITGYGKGGKYYGPFTVADGQLPEEGTIVDGSVYEDYCVLQVGSTYYYYERTNEL
jgi:hypothetical protein